MGKRLIILISALVFIGVVNGARVEASTCTWDFCDPNNWPSGQLPGPGDEVTIDCCAWPCDPVLGPDCHVQIGRLRWPGPESCDCSSTLYIGGSLTTGDWRADFVGCKTATLMMTGGSFAATGTGDSARLNDDGDSTCATFNFGGTGVVNLGGHLRSGDGGGKVFIDVFDNCVLNVGGYMRIGDDGGGWMKFRGNCNVTVGENLRMVCREMPGEFYLMENAEVWVGGEAQLGDHDNHPCDSYITGGTLNADVVKIGPNGKTYEQTGGLVIARDLFKLGTNSTVNLNGGTIVCGDLQIEEGGGIVICGGTLIIDGFWPYPVTISSYCPRPAPHIYGGITCCYGRPVFDYITNPGKTTIYCAEFDPLRAWDPGPPNGTINVSPVDLTICWRSGDGLGLGRHHVFFSEDYDCVANADCAEIGAPCWKAQLRASTTEWNPGPLELWKTYYWRIDEAGITCCKGKAWRFTTGCALIPGDVNLDCVLDFEDFAAVAETFGKEQFWPEEE